MPELCTLELVDGRAEEGGERSSMRGWGGVKGVEVVEGGVQAKRMKQCRAARQG